MEARSRRRLLYDAMNGDVGVSRTVVFEMRKVAVSSRDPQR